MKIKIIASRDEKIWSAIIAAALVVFIWVLNRRYMYMVNVEFVDGLATKLFIKTGFIFPEKIEIEPGKEPVEKKLKRYPYRYVLTPVKDKKGKPTGEYDLAVFKDKEKKPYKTLHIYKDEYYVKYLKTPLGRI